MAPAFEPIETLTANERAEEKQAKVEGWQLFWRFFWSAGLIVCVVAVATMIAHFAGQRN
jgi:hypothetical protein